MEQYDEDKYIDWAGNIPRNWKISKIGGLYSFKNIKVSDEDYPPLSVTKNGILPQLENAAKSDAHDDRKLVNKGDFVINSRSDRRGSCGISSFDGSVSLINIVLNPKISLNSEYYNWLFHTELFADEFYKWGNGIVDDLWSTKWQNMKNIKIPVPPIDEQKSIAEFLNKKCNIINSSINDEIMFIEKYNEYKHSLITEVVTKGLNSNVPMKDSGIEWIGEIPKHWSISKIKYHSNLNSGKEIINELNYDDDVINVYGSGGLFKYTDTYLYDGESVLFGRKGTLGKPIFLNKKFWVVDTAYYLTFKNSKLCPKFCYYHLIFYPWDKITTKTAKPSIVGNDVINSFFAFPPINEQKEIIEYLDKKCNLIDSLISQKEKLIEKLEEYKNSLIFEYVTGKKGSKMMFNINEREEYQKFIIDYLINENGYVQRYNKNFNQYYAMDIDCLFEFLYHTQQEKMEQLEKIHKTDLKETIINIINNSITHTNLINVLKHGVEIDNIPLDLMYTKPATTFNTELIEKYENNIFSVAEEVYASENERIDLVIFLNGLAIISFELKSNTQGQSYEDAIYQYRTERNPKNRLFLFKAGCFVNFAMDLEEVYMTTRLTGDDTVFLPFNMGDGDDIHSGSGNPIFEDKYGVSYMWEDVLKKDSILEIISKFIFIEVKEKRNELTGKIEKKETIIFPRYHQRDAIHKLLNDVSINKTNRNYLIQHSAGSGKTNTIAWLAYRLSSLHDKKNKIIFDNIIVVTDRVVVDRQLQAAIRSMEHKSGLIRVMDDKCVSQDLAIALNSNTKIIATTIQKFPYIVDNVSDLKDKKFAVIIDEAHSSTSGKDMAAVTKVLGKDNLVDVSSEDLIVDEIKRHGKQSNVSMFAFTATPKPTTLNIFGKTNKNGQKEAFHIYSMKQAIEEGFILDVLQNYITYDTYFKLNKEIEEDPNCKTSDAKRQIARFIELHDTNINQRIEIIIEHFRNNVMNELEGKAKAMVITPSREAAVKYYKAFKDYIAKMNYSDIQPLVAFSEKVSVDDIEYTEFSINGFSEEKLPNEFDKDNYQVLLVANKYQAGFDQPKLCAMYVLKKLRGVNAVQTFSRLNRICPPYDKKTFILDFKNDYADIENAFSVYYDRTLLSETVNPHGIYDIESEIDGYYIIDSLDVDIVNELIYKPKLTPNEKNKLRAIFQRTKKNLEKNTIEEQNEFIKKMKNFVRFYEFLLQASNFEDVELHKKYNFIVCFLSFVNIRHPGDGYNLDGKISAMNFVQKKTGEYTNDNHVSKPIVNLPTTGVGILNEEKELKLSEIIAEINARTGNNFDNDITIKAILQIRDLLVKSDELKIAAKNNTERDFELKFFEVLDEALIDGINVNKDFFTLLLNDDETKKEVLGIFAKDVYNELKE